MTFERLVGLFFFIGSILILVITFYPETNSYIVDDDITEDKNSSSNIKINSNNKLLVQFRARVDADKRANGYRIKLRQVLEAGTGLFYL